MYTYVILCLCYQATCTPYGFTLTLRTLAPLSSALSFATTWTASRWVTSLSGNSKKHAVICCVRINSYFIFAQQLLSPWFSSFHHIINDAINHQERFIFNSMHDLFSYVFMYYCSVVRYVTIEVQRLWRSDRACGCAFCTSVCVAVTSSCTFKYIVSGSALLGEFSGSSVGVESVIGRSLWKFEAFPRQRK